MMSKPAHFVETAAKGTSLAIPCKARGSKAISAGGRCRIHTPGRNRELKVPFRATTRRQAVEKSESRRHLCRTRSHRWLSLERAYEAALKRAERRLQGQKGRSTHCRILSLYLAGWSGWHVWTCAPGWRHGGACQEESDVEYPR